MPKTVKYLNFRAALSGEHAKNEGRYCMGYPFVGGVYEARLSEKDARIAHRVLTTYFGAETEEVADAPVPEENEVTKPAAEPVGEVDGKDGASAGNGTKAPAPKRTRSTGPKNGKDKSKTTKQDGQKGTDSTVDPKTSDLV